MRAMLSRFPIHFPSSWRFSPGIFADGRHFQIVFLTAFLSYGILVLQWPLDPVKVGVTMGSCLAFQGLGALIWKKDMASLKSAYISSLSLTLMLKTDAMWAVVLACALSILPKFIIHIKGKHVFNPTNFGIVMTVLFSHEAWISPGQWGSNALLWAFIGIAGLTVIWRVGRWDTAFTFIGVLALLEFSRTVLYLGWPVDHFFHLFTSGTLLLFTFFMITDPVTTPSSLKARILWTALVAGLSFYLTYWRFVTGAPLYALFIVSALTPVFDSIFKSPRFQWISK